MAIGRRRASLRIFRIPAMERFHRQQDLEIAIAWLIEIEPRFGLVHVKHGTPSLRRTSASLESLLSIITDQFLSLQAGAAIWARLKARLEDVSPHTVLSCQQEELVSVGLSRAKAKCFHACALAALDFDHFVEQPSNAIRERLLAIWGIGPWTADIFLLTAVADADAWPVGDLALQVAAQDLLGLRQRPDGIKMDKIARAWRPYRAAAARLLWAHYRGLKSLAQAPSQN